MYTQAHNHTHICIYTLLILVIYFGYSLCLSLEWKFHLRRSFYLFYSSLEFSVPIRSLKQERGQLLFVEWIIKKMVRNQSWSPQLFFSPLHCCRCPWQCDFAVLPYEEVISGTFLMAQWLRLHSLNARGLHLIPGQGNRSHMPQLSVHTTTKTFPGTGK